VWRIRARERHWRTCSGGIHASGSRPSASSSRSQRASSRSVFARRLRPRSARARLYRLGEMRRHAGRGQRVTDEQAARARLDRDVDFAAREARDPARRGRRRGVDPAACHLTRFGVQRVEGDMRTMHVKPGYDRHQGLL